MLLKQDDHILFFGDSITDAGWRSEGDKPLGKGYVASIASTLTSRYPQLKLKVTNRGISGNRVYDLQKRLQADVLDLKPTVVSILIGINDTWRRFDRDMLSPVEDFLAAYRLICSRIKEELSARLVLCEPFLLPVTPDRAAWRQDLDPRIHAVRQVAVEFASAYVPLDGLFAAAACRQPAAHWADDGVHPTPAGHALIAEAWIKAVCGE
jgi:lysophospholipase L1-like esterase